MACLPTTNYRFHQHSVKSPPSRAQAPEAATMPVRVLSCQKRHEKTDQPNSSESEGKIVASKKAGIVGGLRKMGKGLTESMRPRRKGGDMGDVVLMGVSFAVYVYMSQKIDCAYCAWISTLN